jgi:hypothetical protein
MQTRRCPRCGRSILAGYSNGGRALAVDVRLDPDPLDAAGELAALHQGRRTWAVHPGIVDAGEAYARTAGTIGRWPAALTLRPQVHADHRCTKGEQ